MLNLTVKMMVWGSLRFWGFCRPYIHIYISTIYISTCLHLYISTYLHIYMSTYLHIYMSTYLHICISTYLHIYISTYLHIYSIAFFVYSKKVVCIYPTFTHSEWGNGRIYTYIQNDSPLQKRAVLKCMLTFRHSEWGNGRMGHPGDASPDPPPQTRYIYISAYLISAFHFWAIMTGCEKCIDGPF